jgi:ATP-binding cassette, subfamily B, bacterial
MKRRPGASLVAAASTRARLSVLRSMLARCDRRALTTVGVLIALNSVAGAAQSVSLKWMVDGVHQHRVAFTITAAIVGGLASGILGMAGRTASNLEDWMATVVGVEVSREILESTARMPGIEHLERPEYLDQVSIINKESTNLARSAFAFTDVGSLAVRILIAMWLLATVQPLLALLPVFVIPSVVLVPKAKHFVERANERAAEPTRASDSLHRSFFDPTAAMEIRLFDCDDALDRRADALWRRMVRIKLAGAARADAVAALGWAALAAGYVFALLLVINQAVHGRATVGDVLLVSALALQLRSNVALTMTSLRQAMTAVGLIDRYIWLREQAAEQLRQRPGNRTVPGRLEHGLAIEGLNFTYPGFAAPALTDIDIVIPAGSTVAIVGENGAGKTTLVKLLCRLYEPTAGRVTMDGVPLADFDITSWRRHLGGSFQDYARIEASMRRSVGCGDPPLMDDEGHVRAALAQADLERLDTGWPAGLATHIGKSYRDGVELSGGQWQKVAIARGLMRPDPLLLVLDEPTSALDPAAEDELYQRYTGMARSTRENGGITVIVSHRFSSVRMADLIVVLHHGHIVESGTHEDLMESGGSYAAMFSEQAAAYE